MFSILWFFISLAPAFSLTDQLRGQRRFPNQDHSLSAQDFATSRLSKIIIQIIDRRGGVGASRLTRHRGGWRTSKTNSTWKAAWGSRASLMRSEPEALFSKWVDAFWASSIYPNGVKAIVNRLVKFWSQSNPELRKASNRRLLATPTQNRRMPCHDTRCR